MVGVIALSIALTGWLGGPVNPVFRLALGAAALCTIMPGLGTDAVGYAIVGVVIALLKVKSRKAESGQSAKTGE